MLNIIFQVMLLMRSAMLIFHIICTLFTNCLYLFYKWTSYFLTLSLGIIRGADSIRRAQTYNENILDNKFIADVSHGINFFVYFYYTNLVDRLISYSIGFVEMVYDRFIFGILISNINRSYTSDLKLIMQL